jgi:hypothetical protein
LNQILRRQTSQIFQTCAAIYQLLLHMVFKSHNWFAMQGPVAIILISWNVIFIWETGYCTKAIKRFALFDLLKLYISTIFGDVNVKNIFLRHTLTKKYPWHFLTPLSLYIFTIWKCIAYNFFCRDEIYFDKILVSEYKVLVTEYGTSLTTIYLFCSCI